jgi:uncharacterized protein
MATPRQMKLVKPNDWADQTPALADALDIQPLTDAHANEALVFLSRETVDNIFMAGLIRDNGVESLFNRGTFYAARNSSGVLEGVALIGHATLVETRTEKALDAFACLAKLNSHAHVIVGQQDKIDRFWSYYSQGGQQPRQICRELLFEQRTPMLALKAVPELRQATLADLQRIMPVNALLAEEESGVNPLDVDARGFQSRLERRIEQGRVWVWMKGARLMFKADVMVDVPGVAYLEGIFVHPLERGRGVGVRCLSQLGRHFLARDQMVCLLVNERNKDAQSFFLKIGYKLRDCYDTIFLQPEN